MKKFIIKYLDPIFLAIIILLSIEACNENNSVVPKLVIPNADFEDWTNSEEFDKPDSWNTSNFSLYDIVKFNTTTIDSITAFSGKYCPRLETKSQIIDIDPVKVVGLLTLGSFDINIATRQAQVNGGISFKGRPKFLSGYYKYQAVGSDQCVFNVTLTKSVSDTVANGSFFSGTKLDWTKFELEIDYRSQEIPDNLNIILLSSDTSIFEVGSVLWVDKLSFIY